MFFGEKHISKKLSVVPPNRLTFAFIPIYEQLCLCCLFESILGQHERTRAKENELLIGDGVKIETCLEEAFKIVTKK